MRKFLAVAITVVALFGLVAPASAQAPAPKVTINGLVDFVATAYKNWPGLDVTDERDRGFYTRERGVFTITGEIGKTKGVWAVELDFNNGAGINNAGNAFNGGTQGNIFPGTTANFDLDTDVASAVETKWLYLETPLTGPGSLMPFIPVPSIVRAGGQPARGHDYKVGMQLSGDIPAVAIETTWAPNLRSTLTYVQIAEQFDKQTGAAGQNEAFAVVASVELDVFKGLTVKPTYSYVSSNGGNCGTGNMGFNAVDGFNINAHCGTGTPTPLLQTRRHTFGGDVRWTAGPISIQPTFLYQWGTQEIPAVIRAGRGVVHDVDINAWIFDTIVGFRTGPLNMEVRGMWTPGQEAQHKVVNGADVNYYQPINSGFAYMAGWSEIQTSGVDYATNLQSGSAPVSLKQAPSYDKYGRIFVAGAVDYSLTPALTLRGLANASWTDEKVDNNAIVTTTGVQSVSRGDNRYLGTEVNAGFTYRFAPNVAFDGIYAYMWAGDALNRARTAGGPTFDAEDIWKAVARVRVTF